MVKIELILDGRGAWEDLKTVDSDDVIYIRRDEDVLKVAVLPHGAHDNKPSIGLRYDFLNGETVIIEVAWSVLRRCLLAIEERYPGVKS